MEFHGVIDGVMAEVPERRSVETGKGILFWRDGFESTLCPYEEAENGSKDGTNRYGYLVGFQRFQKQGNMLFKPSE